jgi:RNA-binding protein
MSLTSLQIRELKKQAHPLKPVVIVGQHGLSENVLAEIDSTLDTHELIKVKLAGADKDDRKALSSAIEEGLSASLVQIIGRVAVFYRPNPKKKKNRIVV